MIREAAHIPSEGKYFSDPFMLPSNRGFPTTVEDSFALARYLWHLVPEIREAHMRLVAHFITDLDWVGDSGSTKERDDLRNMLNGTLHLKGGLFMAGMSVGCFGNGFTRVHLPFDRYLIDARNGRYRFWPVSMFKNLSHVSYNWERMTYTVPDPLELRSDGTVGNTIECEFLDRKVLDPNRISIVHLNPEYLLMERSLMSDRVHIVDRFDPEFLADIKNNRMLQINDTPSVVLRAVAKDMYFRYDEDEIFHIKEPTLPGLTNSGWGCPPIITNYRSVRQLMVYRKIDEAVGLDYSLPFRVVTPNPGPNISDTSLKIMLGPWKMEMAKMFRLRRQDHHAFHTLPFPVNYQEFAASGKQLAPTEQIEWHTKSVLNAFGYPAELFYGTMNIQEIPTALRIMENRFTYLQHGLNMMTKWIVRKVRLFLQQTYIEPELQLPRVADDLEQRGIYLQLTAGGEIPRRVSYGAFNIKDPVAAAKERMREDLEIQEAQAELQAQAQRKQQMGSVDSIVMQQMQQQQSQPAAGGSPPQGGGPPPALSGNITPLDIMSQAKTEAQRLLQMPEGQRFTELRNMKATNEALHAAVKQQMDEIRSKGGSVGRQNALQLLSGGGGQ